MGAMNRRMEIIDFLMIKRATTTKELAHEFGVSVRTIGYDIQHLTRSFPIYTKQGEHGGVFLREDYRPYKIR